MAAGLAPELAQHREAKPSSSGRPVTFTPLFGETCFGETCSTFRPSCASVDHFRATRHDGGSVEAAAGVLRGCSAFVWQDVVDGSESGTNRGRLRGQVLLIGCVGEVGVPASVVLGEGVVEDAGADLQ